MYWIEKHFCIKLWPQESGWNLIGLDRIIPKDSQPYLTPMSNVSHFGVFPFMQYENQSDQIKKIQCQSNCTGGGGCWAKCLYMAGKTAHRSITGLQLLQSPLHQSHLWQWSLVTPSSMRLELGGLVTDIMLELSDLLALHSSAPMTLHGSNLNCWNKIFWICLSVCKSVERKFSSQVLSPPVDLGMVVFSSIHGSNLNAPDGTFIILKNLTSSWFPSHLLIAYFTYSCYLYPDWQSQTHSLPRQSRICKQLD